MLEIVSRTALVLAIVEKRKGAGDLKNIEFQEFERFKSRARLKIQASEISKLFWDLEKKIIDARIPRYVLKHSITL